MSNAGKFSQVVSYFETLAREHKAISHSDFEKHFFRYELDEVFTGVHSQMNYPALVLEGYGFSFTDNASDNIIKRRTGAFILIEHIPDPGDYNYIHQIWDKLEEISDDIIARIRADKRKPGSPVKNIDMSSINGSLISTEFGNLYGIRITYSFDGLFAADVDSDKWKADE